MTRTGNSRTWVAVLAVSVFAVTLVLAACQVRVAPGGNGGVQIKFTVAGKTFNIELGDAGVFDIAAGAEPVRNSVSVELFSETPTDQPGDAEFIVEAANVQILSAAGTAQRPFTISQAVPEGSVRVRGYLAGPFSTDPCSDGTLVMDFELRPVNGQTVMYVNDQPVDVRAVWRVGASRVGLLRSGLFTLCLAVSSDNVTSRIIINRLGVRFYPADEPTNGNANDNDNANANDNSDDNANDNMNDNADDNDNGEPVDPRDPDGDGNFDAQTCDGWDWVEVSAEDPPRYEGSPGNVACLAKIHFKNNGSGNVVIWWHVTKEVPATGTVTEDGWYSTGLGPGQERDSVESAWIYSSENNTLLHVVTSEVMVSRYDNEYERGCRWLIEAIREDDSAVELYRIDVTDLNPCE
jgi:hypothetical protein